MKPTNTWGSGGDGRLPRGPTSEPGEDTSALSHRLFTIVGVSLDRPMTRTTETLEVLFGWRTAPPVPLVERIMAQYRWVARYRDHGWVAIVALFVAVVASVNTDAGAGRSTATVWLAWLVIAECWLMARYTPLVAAPVAYVGLLSHLPAPEPRNAREDAVQRVVRFTLAVSAAASLTMFGLHREYQLGGLDAIDTTTNAELEAAVLAARQSVESSWWLGTIVVLAVAIVVGVSRWLRDVDRSLYDAGICPPDRRNRQPSGMQYFAVVAAFAGTLIALLAVVTT